MTTRATKAIYRELATTIGGRALIVGIHPNGYITVRLKGTRRTAEARADWLYRNREGIAAHHEKLARRRSRRATRIAAQWRMAIDALPSGE